MNTHGHESVAKAAGQVRLAAGFDAAGMGERRLTAFYLGNWLADLSQVHDPSAGATAREKLRSMVKAICDNALLETLSRRTRALGMGELVPICTHIDEVSARTEVQSKLEDQLDDFFNHLLLPVASNSNETQWFRLVQPAVLLKGYFKFAHPETADARPRMDLDAYFAVFDALFTRYYPHEHLDRPIHPDGPRPPEARRTRYADRVAGGPRNIHNQQSLSPDLYDYLRDDLQIIAAHLTDLDLTWASRFLQSPPTNDADRDWNVGLAQLGHALHGIEDFFAHSSYIEHAARVLREHVPDGLDRYTDPFNYGRFFKRLKRYDYTKPGGDWGSVLFEAIKDLEDEDNIVTGYFDFVDTGHSFLHLAEAGLPGSQAPDAQKAHDSFLMACDGLKDPIQETSKLARRINRIFFDLFELLHDPKRIMRDQNNEVAKAIRDAASESVFGDLSRFIEAIRTPAVAESALQGLANHLPLLQEIDGGTAHGVALLKAFTSYVHGMMVAVAGGKAAVSVYKTIKTVLDINAGPMVWLKDEFKGGIIGWIHAAGHYYAHELVVGAAGMDRIGCHSLLSKDQGGEYLYAQMKDCATAVHYYIVDVMMRWADPAYRNRPEKEQWVDWLELVEYFTLHPRTNQSTPNQTKDVAVQFIHLLTAEELALGFDPLIDALVARYAPLTLMPTALPFTRQTILHANGDTLLQGMNMRRVAEDAFVACCRCHWASRYVLAASSSHTSVIKSRRAIQRM